MSNVTMHPRRFRVVFQDTKGKRTTIIVQAFAESDAVLLAQQEMRRRKDTRTFPSIRAIPTED